MQLLGLIFTVTSVAGNALDGYEEGSIDSKWYGCVHATPKSAADACDVDCRCIGYIELTDGQYRKLEPNDDVYYKLESVESANYHYRRGDPDWVASVMVKNAVSPCPIGYQAPPPSPCPASSPNIEPATTPEPAPIFVPVTTLEPAPIIESVPVTTLEPAPNPGASAGKCVLGMVDTTHFSCDHIGVLHFDPICDAYEDACHRCNGVWCPNRAQVGFLETLVQNAPGQNAANLHETLLMDNGVKNSSNEFVKTGATAEALAFIFLLLAISICWIECCKK